jgi:uncharacterized protein (TIGR02001 family)
MRLSIIAVSLLSALSALPAFADETPVNTFTGNITIASDYRFRGISQTFKLPAIQGGLDYSHISGLYAGTWMSNVSSNSYANGNSMEWDGYGGYKFPVGPVTFDFGGLYYYYPGAHFSVPAHTKYDNFELYGAASWKWLTFKYSYALTDFFGTNGDTYGGDDSKGSVYYDLSANVPVAEKVTLNAHVGHQTVANYGDLSYTDWKLGATYDLNGWGLSAAYIGTNAKKDWYYACNDEKCKKTGEGTVVVSVSKTF